MNERPKLLESVQFSSFIARLIENSIRFPAALQFTASHVM